uniref:(northern house mosquito) hypothetical protein n=1 Tax=Culex pipiens TaxID=7175 RepID=A0A8D8KDU3_CULPI
MAPRLSAGAVQGGPSGLFWRGRSKTWSANPPQQQRPGGSSISRSASVSASDTSPAAHRELQQRPSSRTACAHTRTNTHCDSTPIAVAVHRPRFSTRRALQHHARRQAVGTTCTCTASRTASYHPPAEFWSRR